MLHSLERASIATLVAAALFQLVTGAANAAQWYPWSFSFRTAHYAVAWILIGALVVHIAVKLPLTKATYAAPMPEPTAHQGPSRRAVLRTALLALQLNGEDLTLDHGYPCRLIAPNRPGCSRPDGSPESR